MPEPLCLYCRLVVVGGYLRLCPACQARLDAAKQGMPEDTPRGRPEGHRGGPSKLTPADVRAIRREAQQAQDRGEYGYLVRIARAWGLSHCTIRDIVRRKSHRHVA